MLKNLYKQSSIRILIILLINGISGALLIRAFPLIPNSTKYISLFYGLNTILSIINSILPYSIVKFSENKAKLPLGNNNNNKPKNNNFEINYYSTFYLLAILIFASRYEILSILIIIIFSLINIIKSSFWIKKGNFLFQNLHISFLPISMLAGIYIKNLLENFSNLNIEISLLNIFLIIYVINSYLFFKITPLYINFKISNYTNNFKNILKLIKLNYAESIYSSGFILIPGIFLTKSANILGESYTLTFASSLSITSFLINITSGAEYLLDLSNLSNRNGFEKRLFSRITSYIIIALSIYFFGSGLIKYIYNLGSLNQLRGLLLINFIAGLFIICLNIFRYKIMDLIIKTNRLLFIHNVLILFLIYVLLSENFYFIDGYLYLFCIIIFSIALLSTLILRSKKISSNES